MTQREPEPPNGYTISFNENDQLKYRAQLQTQAAQKPKSLRNESIDPNEEPNPALLLSDQADPKKKALKKLKQTKKKVDFLSLNRKFLSGRPKNKKFGLIDTKLLDKKSSNFNSTDNLFLNVEKKKKPVGKKKSIKPAEVFSDQDASRRAREREGEKKRSVDVTPPNNYYAVNINVVKQ